MERAQALKIVFVMILFAIINIFANIAISHAESVYNFYFNPDEKPGANVNPSQPTGPLSQDEPAPIRPRELAPSSSYLPKEKVDWGDDFSIFRVGAYYTGFLGHKFDFDNAKKEFKNVEGASAGTLSLQLFPSKFLGFFGEALLYKSFNKFAYVVGGEIVPIHISIFGYEDLLALGGELGWSSYKAGIKLKPAIDSLYDPSFNPYQEKEMKWFAGAKTRVKLSKELSADLGVRKSFNAPIWGFNAGVSYYF